MTVNVLKLHIRKVHRISCVDDFICPNCTHPVFSPPSNDDNDDANAESNESILDRNLMNQGCIPFEKLESDENQVRIKIDEKHQNLTNEQPRRKVSPIRTQSSFNHPIASTSNP